MFIPKWWTWWNGIVCERLFAMSFQSFGFQAVFSVLFFLGNYKMTYFSNFLAVKNIYHSPLWWGATVRLYKSRVWHTRFTIYEFFNYCFHTGWCKVFNYADWMLPYCCGIVYRLFVIDKLSTSWQIRICFWNIANFPRMSLVDFGENFSRA